MLKESQLKALVTGSGGFAGEHLTEELVNSGYTVTGLDAVPGANTIQADILKENELGAIMHSVRPDVIFHLAGQASVAKSWDIPRRTFEVNVIGTINLIEAVKGFDKNVRIVLIGSSDEYGDAAKESAIFNEEMVTHPQNPYAASKKAQEEIARIYVKAKGLNICLTRSFNHSGAGQKPGFIISDFCSSIVSVEKGLQESIKVGNLDAKRDFTHVKDVVRAYRLIGERGISGEVYNVGSGKVYSGQEILDRLLSKSKCNIKVERDPLKLRISDAPVIQCDNRKLVAQTGWKPQHDLDKILQDTLDYYREKDA